MHTLRMPITAEPLQRSFLRLCCTLTSFHGAGINLHYSFISIFRILMANTIVHAHLNDVDSIWSQVIKGITSTLYTILIVLNVL